MEYKRIEDVNKRLTSVDIKGKMYNTVNQRILAFRELFENGSIETEIVSLSDGICTFKAVVRDDNGRIISTGYAQEKESSSFINKTSYIENCETSAVGRALGFIGIGATESIASAEEVLNAISNQNKKKEETPKQNAPAKTKCRRCKKNITDEETTYSTERFKMPLCSDCQIAAEEYEKAKIAEAERKTSEWEVTP